MIFDSHAHYDDKQFDSDRAELLSSMEKEGTWKIVNVGSNLATSRTSVKLAKEYDFIYAAVGVHPSDVGELSGEGLGELEEMSRRDKVVAIGEIGLDYYWEKDREVRKSQQDWFVRQLSLARDVGLPVIIHSRDAAEDTMEIIKENGKDLRMVIHCYSYAPKQAMEYVEMGYYIGIGGVLTFSNAKKLKEVAAEVPLDRILLETDCPYLAPVPNRGKRNESRNLGYVAEELATIRGISVEEIYAATFQNAVEFYRIGADPWHH